MRRADMKKVCELVDVISSSAVINNFCEPVHSLRMWISSRYGGTRRRHQLHVYCRPRSLVLSPISLGIRPLCVKEKSPENPRQMSFQFKRGIIMIMNDKGIA